MQTGAYRRRSALIGADRRLSVHQLSFSSNRILERDVVADGIRDFTIPFRSKRFNVDESVRVTTIVVCVNFVGIEALHKTLATV